MVSSGTRPRLHVTSSVPVRRAPAASETCPIRSLQDTCLPWHRAPFLSPQSSRARGGHTQVPQGGTEVTQELHLHITTDSSANPVGLARTQPCAAVWSRWGLPGRYPLGVVGRDMASRRCMWQGCTARQGAVPELQFGAGCPPHASVSSSTKRGPEPFPLRRRSRGLARLRATVRVRYLSAL